MTESQNLRLDFRVVVVNGRRRERRIQADESTVALYPIQDGSVRRRVTSRQSKHYLWSGAVCIIVVGLDLSLRCDDGVQLYIR